MNPTKQRNGQYIYVRRLLKQSRGADAATYAAKCGFTLDDIPNINGDGSPGVEQERPPGVEELEWDEPKAAVEAQIQADAAADIAAALDPAWPTETEAIIWSECPNPRLWIIKLKDGRLCSMHRTDISWRINSKVSVRLVKTQGGACYEAVKVGRPAF